MPCGLAVRERRARPLVARVEEDRAAGREEAVEPLDRLRRRLRLARHHRPVEQREEHELVTLDIDFHRRRRLDRGAAVEHVGQAGEPGADLGVDLGDAGADIGEVELADVALMAKSSSRGARGLAQATAPAAGRPPPPPRRAKPRQQAAQRIGDDEIDERQRQRRAQKPGPEIDLGAAHVALAHDARRQRRQRRESLHRRREVERAARVGRAVEARRMMRGRERRRRNRRRRWSPRWPARDCSRPNPSSVSTGGSGAVGIAGDAFAQSRRCGAACRRRGRRCARFDHSGSAVV